MSKQNIPNILTSIRIFLIPLFIYVLLFDINYLAAFIIFTFASITDWFDGYFARKYNSITKFGIFFDPLADKVLVLSAFYSFLYIDLLDEGVYLWMVVIILLRDISITLLRIISQSKGGFTIVTSKIAKAKTATQLIAINVVLLFLTCSQYDILFLHKILSVKTIFYLMLLTTVITFYTGIHYYVKNSKQLIKNLL